MNQSNVTRRSTQSIAARHAMHSVVVSCRFPSATVLATKGTVCLLQWTVRSLSVSKYNKYLNTRPRHRLNNSLLCPQHRSNRSKKWILVDDVRSFTLTWGKVHELCFKGAVWDSYRHTDRQTDTRWEGLTSGYEYFMWRNVAFSRQTRFMVHELWCRIKCSLQTKQFPVPASLIRRQAALVYTL